MATVTIENKPDGERASIFMPMMKQPDSFIQNMAIVVSVIFHNINPKFHIMCFQGWSFPVNATTMLNNRPTLTHKKAKTCNEHNDLISSLHCYLFALHNVRFAIASCTRHCRLVVFRVLFCADCPRPPFVSIDSRFACYELVYTLQGKPFTSSRVVVVEVSRRLEAVDRSIRKWISINETLAETMSHDASISIAFVDNRTSTSLQSQLKTLGNNDSATTITIMAVEDDGFIDTSIVQQIQTISSGICDEDLDKTFATTSLGREEPFVMVSYRKSQQRRTTLPDRPTLPLNPVPTRNAFEALADDGQEDDDQVVHEYKRFSTSSSGSKQEKERALDGPESFQILIKASRSITLQVTSSDTINDTKAKVFDKLGIPTSEQRLILGKRELNNTKTIRQSGVKKGCVIHLKQRLRGGGGTGGEREPLKPITTQVANAKPQAELKGSLKPKAIGSEKAEPQAGFESKVTTTASRGRSNTRPPNLAYSTLRKGEWKQCLADLYDALQRKQVNSIAEFARNKQVGKENITRSVQNKWKKSKLQVSSWIRTYR